MLIHPIGLHDCDALPVTMSKGLRQKLPMAKVAQMAEFLRSGDVCGDEGVGLDALDNHYASARKTNHVVAIIFIYRFHNDFAPTNMLGNYHKAVDTINLSVLGYLRELHHGITSFLSGSSPFVVYSIAEKKKYVNIFLYPFNR